MKVSNNDNRTYHQLILDNGLQALLVSDYSSDKSAAALTVNTGHFDDPIDRQGMAHFLEHMLFLGTKQHPQPGQFSQFISQAGGQSNAWTGTEHSCYFFDCAQQQFFDAVALFAEFFVEPLLDASQTQNERNAIDAEFKMKIKDDGRRIYQVHKETVNPLHPFAKFSVGNSETLNDRDTCIADEVREFFQQHYQAQWMTLVVAGPHSLVELEAQIRQQFNPIKGTNQQKNKINTPLYRKQDQGLLLHIAPRKHMQKLIVSFAMDGIDDLYKHKSVSFLAHLLGYEGEGSLYSILKQQGWINALSAGGGVSGSNFKDFNISFALTDEGIDYYEDIIEMVFEYIALIKVKTSSLPLLYKDKKTLLDIAFNNQEPSRLLEWVSNISVNMHHYEPDDYLYGDYIMQGFDENLHTRICDFLIPNNMRVVLIHPDVNAQLKAKWYHTPYQIEQLSTEWLSALTHIDTALPEMQLPKVNPYLQVENELYDVTQKSHTPTLLKDKPGFAFWFKQDSTFRVTKGHFYIEIDSLLGIKNTKHMALTRLFADLLMDSMAEQYYPAELAGLNYHINSHQGGLTLHTAGLSGNQITLALQLLAHMLHAVISATRFAEYKKQLIRHWKNHNHNKPVSELFSVLGAKLMPWNPEPLALAKALKNISFNEFCQFRNQFFDSIYIKAFLHGNWQQQHALDMQKRLRTLFTKSEILEDLKRPLMVLDSYQHQHIEKPGCEHALVYYIQAQTDKVFEKVALMMLNQLISQQYFESLRTQQQLGYLVGAGYAPFNTRAGIAFYIQSPNIDAQQLLTKHNQFVSQFIEQLDFFDDAIWQDAIHALRLQVAEKDKNLRLRAQRFWIAITNDDHQFNMQKRLVKQIDRLDKEELISFIKMVFSSSHPKIALRCN